MKKDNEKLNKIKELYNNYKEAKKDPRKRAGMKLVGYIIFFIIFFFIAYISNFTNTYNTDETININTTTTTTKVVDKYVEKQNKLLTDKINVKYTINYNSEEYILNGTLNNNILEGYLEHKDNIKKIIIKNKEIFEIINEAESKLEISFNIDYINIEHILNTIKQTSAFINETENIKTYLYEINKNDVYTKIYLKTDEENITEIKIEESENIYNLNFDK